MGEYLPKWDSEDNITVIATAAITGGQLVDATGAPAAAGSFTVIGVAGHDAAIGQTVVLFNRGVQRPVASGGIAAAALVKAAASGKVATYTQGTDDPEALIGIAIAAATDGNPVLVKFIR